MTVKLATSSAVVVAQHFNPSVTGQHWLIDKRIVLQEELQAGSVFMDMFVQVPTRDYNLVILQNNCQLIIAPHVDLQKQQALIRERLGEIVKLLPHTPYTGVGLNFVWHYFPDNEAIGAACRRMFFLEDKPLHKLFNKGDAKFGVYVSKDWNRFRLHLDARPIILTPPGGEQSEMIQFSFNYHCPVTGRPEPFREILNAFEDWDASRDDSSSIVDTTTTKGQ